MLLLKIMPFISPLRINMVVAEKMRRGSTQMLKQLDFSSVAVLLSSLQHRSLRHAERSELSSQISIRIDRLERDLKDDAAVLRRGVRDYIIGMNGSQPSSVGPFIIRLKEGGRTALELGAGEVDSKGGAEEKIATIINACIAVAESDLAFLRKISAQLNSPVRLSKADLARLQDALEQRSYRRCIEEV